MNVRRLALLGTLLGFVAFATVAVATESELTTQATVLDTDFHQLRVRFDADVESHAVLRADLEALEVRLSQLQADRAQLPPGCGCAQLDALIAHAVADDQSLKSTAGGWEEQG